MLYRAAVIYVMSVVVMLLAATVAWQRIAMASLSADATTANHIATELNQQLDNAKGASGEAERLVRISQQAFEEEAVRREQAERSLLAIRAELDGVQSATQTAARARKEAESKLDHRRLDFAAQTRALLLLRAELVGARAQASAARSELDTLRRQLPMATTGSISSTTGSSTAGEPAASHTSAADPSRKVPSPKIAVYEAEAEKSDTAGATTGLMAPSPADQVAAPAIQAAKESPAATAAPAKDDGAGESAKTPPKPARKAFAGRRPAHKRDLSRLAKPSETSEFPF